MDLSVRIGDLELKSPALPASGTFGYGLEYEPFLDLSELAGVVVKGLHMDPQEGNPPPRMVETPCGVLNSIGLQSIGISVFEKEVLPKLRKYSVPVIANFWGRSEEEYESAFEHLSGLDGVSALELNVSCPNIKKGGLSFGDDPLVLKSLVSRLRRVSDRVLIVKLSPNSPRLPYLAQMLEGEGVDALSLVNTFLAMAINIETRKPYLSKGLGGLSGPAIRPIALRMVWSVASVVQIPVIGVGGITDYRSALEFTLAGASAFQIGTAHFSNPRVCLDVIAGIRDYLKRQKIPSYRDLIGALEWSPELMEEPSIKEPSIKKSQ